MAVQRAEDVWPVRLHPIPPIDSHIDSADPIGEAERQQLDALQLQQSEKQARLQLKTRQLSELQQFVKQQSDEVAERDVQNGRAVQSQADRMAGLRKSLEKAEQLFALRDSDASACEKEIAKLLADDQANEGQQIAVLAAKVSEANRLVQTEADIGARQGAADQERIGMRLEERQQLEGERRALRQQVECKKVKLSGVREEIATRVAFAPTGPGRAAVVAGSAGLLSDLAADLAANGM